MFANAKWNAPIVNYKYNVIIIAIYQRKNISKKKF